MIDSLKLSILDFLSLFTLEWILIICLVLVVFAVLFGIAVATSGIISAFFHLLAFLCIVSTPFALRYASTNYFFSTTINYAKVAPMQFSPSFFVDVNIKNTGTRNIKECIFTININRANKLLNFLDDIYPIKSYKYRFKANLAPNQTLNKVFIIDNFKEGKDAKYNHNLYCF